MTRLREGIHFLPAPSSGSHKYRFRHQSAEIEIIRALRGLKRRLHDRVDIIVFDCHGAADPVTYASVEVSDRVILVSEPDPIAFGGTLEWLEDLRKRGSYHEILNKVVFVINRVPPRFSIEGISEALKSLFGDMKRANGGIKFVAIPSERTISDLFGRLPFVYDVAVGTVFRSKIRLLVLDLLSDLDALKTIPDEVRKKIKRPFWQRRVRRRVDTIDALVKRHLLWFAALMSVMFTVMAGLALTSAAQGASLAFLTFASGQEIHILGIVTVTYAYIGFVATAMFLLFMGRMRVDLAMLRASGGPLKVWSALSFAVDTIVALSVFLIALALDLVVVAAGVTLFLALFIPGFGFPTL